MCIGIGIALNFALSLSWHCWERGPYSWSRVATLGRGQLPPQLGVFFREASQLRGRILGAFGLRIENSVFNAIIFIVIGILVLTVGRIE